MKNYVALQERLKTIHKKVYYIIQFYLKLHVTDPM